MGLNHRRVRLQRTALPLSYSDELERIPGIESGSSRWQRVARPLSYIRVVPLPGTDPGQPEGICFTDSAASLAAYRGMFGCGRASRTLLRTAYETVRVTGPLPQNRRCRLSGCHASVHRRSRMICQYHHCSPGKQSLPGSCHLGAEGPSAAGIWVKYVSSRLTSIGGGWVDSNSMPKGTHGFRDQDSTPTASILQLEIPRRFERRISAFGELRLVHPTRGPNHFLGPPGKYLLMVTF